MKRFIQLSLAGALVVSLSACSQATNSPSLAASSSSAAPKTLTVITHDSFTLPDELKKKFADETGYTVTYATADSGALVNQLILSKDSPLADVVYGIDNTFASRANQAGILSDYTSPAAPANAANYQEDKLTPIDFGDVCLNADTSWFAAKGLALPSALDDLTKPEYKDLTVVINPASSSTGLAFMLATISAKGDGWLDYWKSLKNNGVKVASGWTEAYSTDFSGADGKGPRPIVLSYATSPAYTVKDGKSNTTALLNTCFRQVEYAGVLAGAKNPEGAAKFIDFLLSEEVQASIPSNMYMYPINTDVKLPAEWVKFAPLAKTPLRVPSADIVTHREEWLQQWSEAIG